MHMADALMSPAVGGTMWAATAATTIYCAKKVREEADPEKVPLMGVAGAFIFASQMLNFTVPATGSSGHLGGGLILAILLGPEAAFLVMASVLTVQALFFADGGLLALGANIFNLGFFPAFIAYPLVYRPVAGTHPTRARLFVASLLAAIVGLQLGALGVVLETVMSGRSELPFATFALLMLPIHLAIGIVEGLVTAGVVLFVARMQPELLDRGPTRGKGLLRPVLLGLAIAALVAGTTLSWFASTRPDGLEWSIERLTGSAELESAQTPVHSAAGSLQDKIAILPDYGFKAPSDAIVDGEGSWPAPDSATSTAGIVGGALVLLVVGGIGFALSRRRKARPPGHVR